jgi:phospholipid/cholesterol/gamma-HCH transport system substrate-binding protein
MLTRVVRIQLVIFTILSIVGVSTMVFRYIQAPTLLGLGRITVTLELPASGGLYRFSNVTYRGVQVGKVTDIKAVRGKRVQARLSLDGSARVPANTRAQVRSVSAVGEQYVDMQPDSESGPYLRNGSVIAMSHTTIPPRTGPMLDHLSALVDSIPKGKLSNLLDETFKAFDGAGYDFGSLLDSSAKLAGDLDGIAARNRKLIDDGVPLLQSQADSTDAIRQWARGLAGVTGQLTRNDPQIRTVLGAGPVAAQQVSALLNQIKPTLPVLLANLTTIGQVAITYHASLEQVLVLLPPNIAVFQSVSPTHNPTGAATGDFSVTVADPPACTVGFLPPSQWRSPEDLTEVDTPDGLYCKLPQDSPIAVRGARNYPCMGHPGKRAPTVQICDSDQPFKPLAEHQHVFGPYPLDPNLLSQGIPPDDRVTRNDRIFAPLEGTPMPPGAPRPGGPPAGSPPAQAPDPLAPPATSRPSDAPDPRNPAAVLPVTPNAFQNDGGSSSSVSMIPYNPQTGAYMGPDGRAYRQLDIANSGAPKSWTDLVYRSR